MTKLIPLESVMVLPQRDKKYMRNLKLIYYFLLNLLMTASSKACNLLNINVGADKSTVEEYLAQLKMKIFQIFTM